MGYTQYARVDNIQLADGVTADSTTALLTMDNIVLLTSTVTIPGTHAGTVFTLDEHECPKKPVYLPVAFTGNEIIPVRILKIDTDGTATVVGGYTGTMNLNGLCYNIGSKFYNDELGTGTYEATSD